MSFSGESNEEQELINQIHDAVRKIREYKIKLENNTGRESFNLSDPIETAFIQNNSILLSLVDEKFTGCSAVRLNPTEDLLKDLNKELEYVSNDIAKITKKIQDNKDFTSRLIENSENLDLMMEACKNAQAAPKKLDIIEKNIKLRFLKEKKELKKVITTLFPDNLDVQDLMAQIVEYYFAEGADKFMQLEMSDNTADQVEFLLRTELFEVNPHNRTQIKLADLL